MTTNTAFLCPGQGAQAMGMGRAWAAKSPAAAEAFRRADELLGESLGAPLSSLCFDGTADQLNKTNVSQPAICVCSVACFRGLCEQHGEISLTAAAGLSLGEYTALHLAGAFDFETGLQLVALRGRLMQAAAEASRGGMVALIGADEAQAVEVCDKARGGDVLVPANFNAPGQIVLSGSSDACGRAVSVAEAMGLKSTPLTVAGAFHSPLMQPAAEGMKNALQSVKFGPLKATVWSNVTAQPHDPTDSELLRQRLVEQIVSPVRWAQSCAGMIAAGHLEFHELAPGSVLRGLMRRIDRNGKVTSHDEPD